MLKDRLLGSMRTFLRTCCLMIEGTITIMIMPSTAKRSPMKPSAAVTRRALERLPMSARPGARAVLAGFRACGGTETGTEVIEAATPRTRPAEHGGAARQVASGFMRHHRGGPPPGTPWAPGFGPARASMGEGAGPKLARGVPEAGRGSDAGSGQWEVGDSKKAEDQVQSGLFLDVVVRQGAPIFQLFPGKDQPLLVWGDALFVLDLGLDVLDGVTGLHLQSDGLAGQGLHEDLHPTSEAEDQVQSGLFLDVVVRQGAPIFQLFPGKDQPLLVWGDALFVLDLGLDVLDGVTGLHLQGDGLAGQGLHEDLHPTSEAEDQVQSGLLLDVVVRQGAPIFQLFPGKDQPLLVWGDALFVLDLGLDVLDGVTGLHLQGDGLAGQGLHEDLHPTSEAEDQVQSGLFLDVVVRQGAPIFQLFPGKDQPLLVWGDALFVLDLALDVLDGVTGLHLQGDGFAGQGLHEDLHPTSEALVGDCDQAVNKTTA
ncbi:TPA: Os05g0242100-like [Bos taurus]|nr:TPA: Os05g0242100-like [Bos taurus]